MDSGCQPVREKPSCTARCGKPSCNLTRDRRSSPQAKTTCPSSMKETVESLSRGLIPSTRIVLRLQLLCQLGHHNGREPSRCGQVRKDALDQAEDSLLVVDSAGVRPFARHQGGTVNGETNVGPTTPLGDRQQVQHVLAKRRFKVQPDLADQSQPLQDSDYAQPAKPTVFDHLITAAPKVQRT